jgi:fermentation-respiration switch protein FrsA (DUF1100 family)
MVAENSEGHSAYQSSDTADFFRSTAERAPTWRNEITLRSIEMSREYEPGIYVPRISPTPLLMIVASEDRVVPSDLALQAFETALQPKELLIVPGGHYVVYIKEFDRTSSAARDFFLDHLK